MRVGFYYIGDIEEYAYLGGLAAAVAKQTMPQAEIVHLTDMDTKQLENVDTVLRLEKNCPMAVLRMRHHQTPGDWLFIDIDALIMKDVSDLFYEAFDIAIANRVPGDGSEHEGFAEMPHNMGVVFSRSPVFWREAEKELLKYTPKMQEWMGDQLAINRLIKSCTFNVKKVSGEKYNFPPSSPLLSDASIVHFKGRRKPWMIEHAMRILAKRKAA